MNKNYFAECVQMILLSYREAITHPEPAQSRMWEHTTVIRLECLIAYLRFFERDTDVFKRFAHILSGGYESLLPPTLNMLYRAGRLAPITGLLQTADNITDYIFEGRM